MATNREVMEKLDLIHRTMDDYRRGTECLATHCAKQTKDITAIVEQIQLQQEIQQTILVGVESVVATVGQIVQYLTHHTQSSDVVPRGGTSIPARAVQGGKLTPFQEATRDVPHIGEAFGRGTCATHNYVHLNKRGQCVECVNEVTKTIYEQRRTVAV